MSIHRRHGSRNASPSAGPGEAATAFTKAAVTKAGSIVVRDPSWGKYGGRVIANLVLDGRTLSTMLIEAGHGRAYAGGKRQGWCE